MMLTLHLRRSGYLRQILMFSDFLTPEINSVFNKYFKNVAGKLKIKQSYEDGTIVDVLPQIQQTFTRIDAPSLSAMDDARFKYFIEKVCLQCLTIELKDGKKLTQIRRRHCQPFANQPPCKIIPSSSFHPILTMSASATTWRITIILTVHAASKFN